MDISAAGAAMGRIRTEKKSRTSAENAAKARETLQDPQKQAAANRKRSEAQKARWAQARAVKEAEMAGTA